MYEAYSDYQSMMNMAEEIVTQCALAVHGKLSIGYQVICSFLFLVFREINLVCSRLCIVEYTELLSVENIFQH